jgi:hypothetical protein
VRGVERGELGICKNVQQDYRIIGYGPMIVIGKGEVS